MGKFKQLVLTELGETTDGYDFRVLSKPSPYKIEFEFKSEQNTYRVSIHKHMPKEIGVTYSYKTEMGTYELGLTGEKNQFRVIATVIDVVKHAWENREKYFEDSETIEKIGFVGTTRDGESFGGDGTARTKLYLQFINRQFPDAEINRPVGGVEIHPPQ